MQQCLADSARAIHLQANALRIAAALTAVAVMFAVALALSQQIRAGAEEWPALRMLGMTERQQVGGTFGVKSISILATKPNAKT